MADPRTAIVVGGGIGGLAAGIALHERGWRVSVLERAPEFREVGAGISVWANALRALDIIGAGLPSRFALAATSSCGAGSRRGTGGSARASTSMR